LPENPVSYRVTRPEADLFNKAIPKPQKVTIVTDDKKDISDVKKLNCESRLLPGGVIQMPDPGCPSGPPIIIPPPPPPSGTGR
jgi:hypothetical protein